MTRLVLNKNFLFKTNTVLPSRLLRKCICKTSSANDCIYKYNHPSNGRNHTLSRHYGWNAQVTLLFLSLQKYKVYHWDGVIRIVTQTNLWRSSCYQRTLYYLKDYGDRLWNVPTSEEDIRPYLRHIKRLENICD